MTQAEAEPSGEGGELIFDEERLRQSVELNRRLEGLGVSPNTEDRGGCSQWKCWISFRFGIPKRSASGGRGGAGTAVAAL